MKRFMIIWLECVVVICGFFALVMVADWGFQASIDAFGHGVALLIYAFVVATILAIVAAIMTR